jgi:predicted nucleic acid-binding protein
MDRLIADTGFLVAFGRSADPLHQKAASFLRGFAGSLVTVAPVIVETSFFLTSQAKIRLIGWVASGGIAIVDIPASSYPDLGATITKYADRDIDFADAALVWLANQAGLRKILTTDKADFGVYRLNGGKRFELVSWSSEQ